MFKKKWFKILLIVFIVLVIVYQFGPHPATPVYSPTLPAVPSNAAALEQYIDSNEAQHKIKPVMKQGSFGLIQPKQKQNMPLFTCMVFLRAKKKAGPFIPILQKNSVAIYI